MAVSEKDFVNVESGTDETYVALDQEIEVYDVEEAIDDINGSIVNGNLEQKVDYLADTKDMIRQAIINKGQPVEENASFRSYADSIEELTGEINNQDVLITENGTYEAESGYTGLGEVTVEVQPALQDKVITQNGTYRADTGYDGLGNVVVNTPVINNQDKTVTENGVYTADSGYSGLGEITVNVPQPEPTLDTLTATANGNYTPPIGIDGYDEVVVNVQPALQDKTITTNGTYTADSGYDGLGEVVVNVADTPAVIDPLSITPSTSQQVITVSSGIDGFSPITVAAVTSAIDSNISAGNIKDGVTILGVRGTYTGGGITPTGTKLITANGTYDVTNYESADVQVPTTAPTYYIPKAVDANGKLVNSGSYLIDFTNINSIGERVLQYAYKDASFTANTVIDMSSVVTLENNACEGTFWGCSGITTVDMSSITIIPSNGCRNMFVNSSITSIDMGSVETVSNMGCYAVCSGCTRLTYANLGLLRTFSASSAFEIAFDSCVSLASIDVSSVEDVNRDYVFRQAFNYCRALTMVRWSSLTEVTGRHAFIDAFSNSRITSLFFPSLSGTGFGTITNQFQNMLSGVSGCTVHFPSNLQSVIGSWSDVQNGFGGTNTTVLFDLPATVTLVGTNSYYRNPKYDTATALAWFDTSATRATPYYTSGTTDPTVGDYIYSDATCTTQVDMIASIS